jgi:hypothetical protein
LSSVICLAQRYSDARDFNFSGLLLKNGYGFTIGYEQLFNKNWSAFILDIESMNRSEKLKIKEDRVNLLNLDISAGYRRYLNYRNFHPYAGVSGILGYESIMNKSKLPESVIIDRKTGIQFAVGIDMGVEYSLKLVSLYASYSPRYEFRNAEYISSFQLGIKYYLK